MGKIVLYNNNCFDILPELPDNSVDLIIIDPPYNIGKSLHGDKIDTLNTNWDKEDVVTPELATQLFRISKPTTSLYVWCGIGENNQSMIRWFPIFSELWHFKDLITWKKQRGSGGRKGWLYTREEIMWFVKDNKQFVWNKDQQYSDEKRKSKRFGFKEHKKEGFKLASENYRYTNVWTDIPEVTWNWKDRVQHATPKPIKALKRIIELHTQEGDTVLDCFAGSGSTLVAAKELNRKYIGIEKDTTFYQIILEQLK